MTIIKRPRIYNDFDPGTTKILLDSGQYGELKWDHVYVQEDDKYVSQDFLGHFKKGNGRQNRLVLQVYGFKTKAYEISNVKPIGRFCFPKKLKEGSHLFFNLANLNVNFKTRTFKLHLGTSYRQPLEYVDPLSSHANIFTSRGDITTVLILMIN